MEWMPPVCMKSWYIEVMRDTQMQAVIGIDFGTASGRAVVFDALTGRELGQAVCPYPSGVEGVLPFPEEPQAVRHDPRDYLFALERAVTGALDAAEAGNPSFRRSEVRAIGVDSTGSSMIPLKADGSLLADDPAFDGNPNAMLWLWKDHSAAGEAEEMTRRCAEEGNRFLRTTGGRCPVEMPWPRLLRLARRDRRTFDAAYTWVELDDWIPFVLSGGGRAASIARNKGGLACKWMYREDLGGFPSDAFFASLDQALVRIAHTFDPSRMLRVDETAGCLCAEWAKRTGLASGIPIAPGMFDGHAGGLGAGIRPGVLVETIGTSAVDLVLVPGSDPVPEIPGMFGVARDAIMPGAYLVEAGRSAVGDLLGWYVHDIAPKGLSFAELGEQAARLKPGQSGLLALDWMNGNRSVFNDASLSGLVLGLTLRTKPEEIYRALVESTAFGARMILEQLESNGHPVSSVIACGGIPRKNQLLVDIYANVLDREVSISRSTQTCALGAAVAASVVGGIWPSFPEAVSHMTGVLEESCRPRQADVDTYNRLFSRYRDLSLVFAEGKPANLGGLMAELRWLGK